jgi:hypothetical protein
MLNIKYFALFLIFINLAYICGVAFFFSKYFISIDPLARVKLYNEALVGYL